MDVELPRDDYKIKYGESNKKKNYVINSKIDPRIYSIVPYYNIAGKDFF